MIPRGGERKSTFLCCLLTPEEKTKLNAKDDDFMKKFDNYYGHGERYRGPVDVRKDEMDKSKLGCSFDLSF